MRLGLRPTFFDEESKSWSKLRNLYGGADVIWERHRHRYEVGPPYVQRLSESGLRFIGKDEKGERMQALELKGKKHMPWLAAGANNTVDHPYFVGLQAHPEFCTRPINPSPPFLGFVAASSSPEVLNEQITRQLRDFRPPHPESAMVVPPVDKVATQEVPMTNGVVDH